MPVYTQTENFYVILYISDDFQFHKLMLVKKYITMDYKEKAYPYTLFLISPLPGSDAAAPHPDGIPNLIRKPRFSGGANVTHGLKFRLRLTPGPVRLIN